MIDINAKLNEIFSPKGKIVFIVLVCLGVIGTILLITSFIVPKKEQPDVQEVKISRHREYRRDIQAIKEPVLEEIEQPEDRMVALADEKNIGRENPFLPNIGNTGGEGADLIAPPTSVPTEDVSNILTTRVSGIMYDSKNPSAILNIEGTDYFVKAGDYISGYKVLSISRDFVTIKSGTNIYRSKVGELVSDSGSLYNTYNLNNRFGGKRK